jgi:hypothetical protein
MMMRAVMPKSMHGLDLATCQAQLEPKKWAQKTLRVCAALELLATAADDKHKTLAKALMMVLADRHTRDSPSHRRESAARSRTHKMLQELGLAVAKSTRSGELTRLVAAEKALNDSVLELAPTWWLAFAAFDNLVALPKTNANSLATMQTFLFFARPITSRSSAGLRAPEHKEHEAPRWTDADEQQFAFCNFIYGYSAIEEELAALPRAPRLLQASAQRVATIGPEPDKPFVGAAHLSRCGSVCCRSQGGRGRPPGSAPRRGERGCSARHPSPNRAGTEDWARTL